MKKPYDAKKYYNKKYYHGRIYADYSEEQNKRRFNRVLDEVQKRKKTGRLLDVGCALGFLLKEAKRRGFETAGVDVSAYAVKKRRITGKLFVSI
ncbi:MAG: methyltransferase domain-containing protein [Candidatus Micrarchaeota archaeon]